MKNVLLSADGDRVVYLVPDVVADHLVDYCLEFCNNWLHHSPDAAKYRHIDKKTGYSFLLYSESDFISYLNDFLFPMEKSEKVKSLGNIKWCDIPSDIKELPYFNF